ncbi:MAG: NADH-quinone oxidoreductase subunit N [Verrucomicrobiae bacterium]|nr:NADH-quinone oxidoreductase subunit N [Verrucomicrobiae bacterium]NNJ41871.1 NADH-quinone oxidoreductase subunit N [Akkermansiaceae bacterium]
MSPHLLEFITVGFGLILLMVEAFSNGHRSRIGLIAAAGLTVILSMLFCPTPEGYEVPTWMSRFYGYDSLARFYKIIALVSTILVLLMAIDFRKVLSQYTSGDDSESGTGEFYCLPIFACAGLMWMASATDLVSIFVALELVTITFYVMVAYMRRNVGSLEAGVKYLILGALSTGFLVYGIAWLYGTLGSTHLEAITAAVHKGDFNPTFLLFGVSLILIALGFKVGAAPMQLWIPDVYQGAPTPITAYLSVASKAAGFVVLMHIIGPFLDAEATRGPVVFILLIMAGATLVYGNLAAISQSNFKRLLAYSSIAHAGFLLIGVATSDFTSVSFYLATYLLMTFASFFVLALVRSHEGSDEIDAFDGLGKRNPAVAFALTICMSALAGIPLTAGFWGKFFIFKSAITHNVSWWLIAIAFVSVAAGFYYYLKVVKAMYWNAPRRENAIVVPVTTQAVLIVLTIAILVLGIYPQPILDLLK